MQDNKLTGSIPSSIGKVRNLSWLDLTNNMLTGNLPVSMGNLSSLEYLNLVNNRLTGIIPSSFGNLKSLSELHLSRNGFSGPIPTQLVKIRSTLTHLDLSYNPLGLGNLPTWLSKMSNFFSLNLAGTGLTGELPEWLSSVNWVSLDLSSNRLTGELPTWIGNLSILSSLNLSNNQFHSDIPTEFKKLSNLVVLDLHSNNFTGGLRSIFDKRTPAGIKLPDGQYRNIDLSYNMFAGPIDQDIGNLDAMHSIRALVLSHNKLTGTIPSEIINRKSLGVFDVSHNMLTGEIPPHNTTFPATSFQGNSGLCGSPLPPCKV
ncbi:hypothetical protein MKW92_005113 [Papaver armeniacum]|nr:hypothetical protein MKW92_005113 [Papaver armeniacum]